MRIRQDLFSNTLKALHHVISTAPEVVVQGDVLSIQPVVCFLVMGNRVERLLAQSGHVPGGFEDGIVAAGLVASVRPNSKPVRSISTRIERLPFHQSRASRPLSPGFKSAAFSSRNWWMFRPRASA